MREYIPSQLYTTDAIIIDDTPAPAYSGNEMLSAQQDGVEGARNSLRNSPLETMWQAGTSSQDGTTTATTSGTDTDQTAEASPEPIPPKQQKSENGK